MPLLSGRFKFPVHLMNVLLPWNSHTYTQKECNYLHLDLILTELHHLYHFQQPSPQVKITKVSGWCFKKRKLHDLVFVCLFLWYSCIFFQYNCRSWVIFVECFNNEWTYSCGQCLQGRCVFCIGWYELALDSAVYVVVAQWKSTWLMTGRSWVRYVVGVAR